VSAVRLLSAFFEPPKGRCLRQGNGMGKTSLGCLDESAPNSTRRGWLYALYGTLKSVAVP